MSFMDSASASAAETIPCFSNPHGFSLADNKWQTTWKRNLPVIGPVLPSLGRNKNTHTHRKKNLGETPYCSTRGRNKRTRGFGTAQERNRWDILSQLQIPLALGICFALAVVVLTHLVQVNVVPPNEAKHTLAQESWTLFHDRHHTTRLTPAISALR